MIEVYVGLGSNLGGEIANVFLEPKAQLEQALITISEHRQIELIQTSSFYRTTAIGPGKQADYINAVAMLETNLSAYALLHFLQSIENQQGRVRTQRWGPRTLDLDILLYGQLIENSDRLTIPHPRLHERAFVLAPMAEINPELTIANRENITQLLANCSTQGILKLSDV